jgi:hypothetical protein
MADIRSDLYSLGCTFFFLLTGEVPFPGGPWTERLLRHRLDPPPPLRELRPEVPEAVAAVVARLLAKDPADRFPTPADLIAQLQRMNHRDTEGTEEDTEQSPKRQRGSCPARSASEGGGPPSLAPRAGPLGFVRRIPHWKALLTAVGVGLLLAGGVRALQSRLVGNRPAVVSQESGVGSPGREDGERVGPGFRLTTRDSRLTTVFATLADALEAAGDGDVVTMAVTGEVPTPPLTLRGKSLTLRAAPGCRPRLVLRPPSAPWQGLLTTDRALTLEGIDLGGGEAVQDAAAPLVTCTGPGLHLVGCNLQTAGPAPAVLLRGGGELTLRRCRIETAAAAVSVEAVAVPLCRITLEDNTVRAADGAAVSVWATEGAAPAAVRIVLERNNLEACRIVALRGLGAPVEVTARDNVLRFREAVLALTGYPRDSWRRLAIWQGSGNRHHGGGAWLTLEGAAIAGDGSSWCRLWGLPVE